MSRLSFSSNKFALSLLTLLEAVMKKLELKESNFGHPLLKKSMLVSNVMGSSKDTSINADNNYWVS
jgi:hypothetical protein